MTNGPTQRGPHPRIIQDLYENLSDHHANRLGHGMRLVPNIPLIVSSVDVLIGMHIPISSDGRPNRRNIRIRRLLLSFPEQDVRLPDQTTILITNPLIGVIPAVDGILPRLPVTPPHPLSRLERPIIIDIPIPHRNQCIGKKESVAT
ncbi:hypothetical protein CSQ87_07525 [Bifidobacterium simiarum]|uniref:Uncharacterized protein n=1 Tax=Bifidobacterium simiarum TaxID=2045441 RepID=A0A2M9HE18_9BIFI|nr:hypothetical protein CSQ87_07525 [Bifidobacterium simiarum]